MSFLELEPEARRLRQVARARAAGEIDHEDYRRLRHQIIDELHVTFSEHREAGQRPFDQFNSGDPANVGDVCEPTLDRPASSAPAENKINRNKARGTMFWSLVGLGLIGCLLAGFVLS